MEEIDSQTQHDYHETSFFQTGKPYMAIKSRSIILQFHIEWIVNVHISSFQYRKNIILNFIKKNCVN